MNKEEVLKKFDKPKNPRLAAAKRTLETCSDQGSNQQIFQAVLYPSPMTPIFECTDERIVQTTVEVMERLYPTEFSVFCLLTCSHRTLEISPAFSVGLFNGMLFAEAEEMWGRNDSVFQSLHKQFCHTIEEFLLRFGGIEVEKLSARMRSSTSSAIGYYFRRIASNDSLGKPFWEAVCRARIQGSFDVGQFNYFEAIESEVSKKAVCHFSVTELRDIINNHYVSK